MRSAETGDALVIDFYTSRYRHGPDNVGPFRFGNRRPSAAAAPDNFKVGFERPAGIEDNAEVP